MSYDRRHRKANSSKQSLVARNWNSKGALAGAKFMIPLVIDHLMSTCFRGTQDPVDSGRPEVTPSRLARADYGRASAKRRGLKTTGGSI